MERGHIRFPVEEEVVPQQQHQQHQNRQQQRNRRRQRNHRRQRNQRQPPVEELQQPPVEELQQLPEALWSPEEDRKLFRSVAEYKKCHNSSLNWKTVQCLYNRMGGVMNDIKVLKIQWARITGLMGAGHFNQLTFFDAECVQDLDLVCPERASASSSRSNNSRSVRSRGYKSIFTRRVAGAIACGYDEQLLCILASNTEAIAELRELGMINKEQEDFAIARYANINRLDTMCEFSFLSSPLSVLSVLGK